MNREEIIHAFVCLGEDIRNNLLSEDYQNMYHRAQAQNGWFIPMNIQRSLEEFLPWLDRKTLEDFSSHYAFAKEPKTIAVVAAGNIPAVCFHDVLCVLLSGHKLMLKLSSSDNIIIPFLFSRLKETFSLPIEFVDKIANFDAVIATGSNSSAMYFETYFGKYPHIIRKSRCSIAVVEKEEDISGIEDDILLYMGLGCRNVSLVFLPNGFSLDALKQRLSLYSHLTDHNKYRNNYDYHKAIFLMNLIPFTDACPMLLQEKRELHAPVSVLYYTYYDTRKEVLDFISQHQEELQCVVSNNFDFSDSSLVSDKILYGYSQKPSIDTFADNVDTMVFLSEL